MNLRAGGKVSQPRESFTTKGEFHNPLGCETSGGRRGCVCDGWVRCDEWVAWDDAMLCSNLLCFDSDFAVFGILFSCLRLQKCSFPQETCVF